MHNSQTGSYSPDTIYDNLPGAVVLLDPAASFTYLNRRAGQLLGHDPAKLIGKSWQEPFVPEDGPGPVLSGFSFHAQRLLLDPDGRERWFHIEFNPVKEGNVVRGYLGMMTDITEGVWLKRDNEEKARLLENLLGKLPVVLYMVDQAGIVTLSVGSGLKFIGMKDNQLQGIDVKEYMPDVIAYHERARAGEVVEFVLRYEFEGRESWFQNILYVDEADPGTVIGLAMDVTKIILAEKEVAEKSQLLNGVLQNLPVIVYKINKEGIFTASAGAGLRALGLKDNEVVGGNVFELFPVAADPLRQAMEGKTASFITGLQGEEKFLYYQTHAFADPIDEGGIIGFALDITEQKEAEESLREAERQLSRAVGLMEACEQISRTGGWEYEVDKDYIYRTQHAGALVGMDRLDKTKLAETLEKYDAETQAVLSRSMEDAVNWQLPFDVELRLKGDNRMFRCIGIPVAEDGRTVRVKGVIMEITEQKLIEATLMKAKQVAEEAALAKQQFLSNMSHEIRTPMNAVIGMAHLLLQDNTQPELEENLRVLKLSGDYLLSLINDILDYSKIESGKVTLEEIDFNLHELVSSIKQAHQLKAEEKDLQFKMRIDSDIPTVVIGDPVRISQILNNLISNAIKFTRQGSVLVDLELRKMDERSVLVDFRITDTGIGIDPAQQEHVFESFTQASADTTRVYGGTGLGLAITRQLLRLMGSDIALDSSLGKGSAFSFSLRLRKSDRKTVQFNSVPVNFESLKGYRVLMAEDNEFNVLIAGKFMQKWDLDVEYANTGKEALEMVQRGHYDIVLMDLQMPEMDGYSASRRIRELPGDEYRKIPIIALTASVLAEIRGKALEAGMNDYISKPFNPVEFYEKIRQYIRMQEQ